MSGAKTRTHFRGDNSESLAYIIKKAKQPHIRRGFQ